MACTFQETICGKFVPLIGLRDEDMYINTIITTYNITVTDAVREMCGMERRRKKPWVTRDVLDLCDERKYLKKKQYEDEGEKRIHGSKQEDSEGSEESKGGLHRYSVRDLTCLNKNNSKLAYQLVKDLTSEKQGRSSTIQDRSGKCLTEEQEILNRCTEYCLKLYNNERCNGDLQSILPEEVEIVVASLKKGGLPELIIYQQTQFKQAETMTDVLTEICNRIWRTGEWPNPWAQSLIIPLPKKSIYSSARNT